MAGSVLVPCCYQAIMHLGDQPSFRLEGLLYLFAKHPCHGPWPVTNVLKTRERAGSRGVNVTWTAWQQLRARVATCTTHISKAARFFDNAAVRHLFRCCAQFSRLFVLHNLSVIAPSQLTSRHTPSVPVRYGFQDTVPCCNGWYLGNRH